MQSDLEMNEPTRKNWISFSSLTAMAGLNAFNDNFARFMLLPLGGWLVAQGQGFSIEHLVGALMVLPFILFAPTAGWLGDRFPKSSVVRWAAWMQLVVLGLMAFALFQRSLTLAVVAFFLLALQSALLSPAKTGILKEILGRKRLALGSGVMDGVTILSVLAGQILAGLVFDKGLAEVGDGWQSAFPPILLVFGGCLFAVVIARLVERTPKNDVGPLTVEVAFRHIRDFQVVWKDRPLRLSSLGIAFFYGFATFIILAVYEVAYAMFGGGEGTGTANSIMMASASIGIAVGSVLAGVISRRGTELGLVPVGGAVMFLGTVLLVVTPLGSLAFKLSLMVAGAGAAVFLVPLKAHLLDISPSDERGKILSVSGLMNNLAGLTAIILQLVFQKVGLPIPLQMAILALVAGGATWYVMKLLPRNFWKFIGIRLIRSFYRIKVLNADQFPQEGGVILCPNHLSFVDSLVITAACPREVRFLIAEKCFRRKWVGKFAQTFNAVPVSPERAKEAIRIAAEEAAAGNVVCIFPEGQLSRSGAPCEVKRGFEMIARKSGCPVVPAYMHGLWGTFTSFAGGRYFRKWPRRLGSGLTVGFGDAIPPREATADAVKESWRQQAATAMDLETIDQRSFADPARFLREEPPEWWQEVHEVGELPAEEFAKLTRQTRELLAVSFWQWGDRVLVEWEPGDSVSRVLGLILPRLAGAKIVLAKKGASEDEILQTAREEQVQRVVLLRKEVSENFVQKLSSEKRVLHLFASWEGGEEALSLESAHPSLVVAGEVLTWSIPHPIEENPLGQFQPGWKEGSVGRLLNGREVPKGWQADKEKFLTAGDALE